MTAERTAEPQDISARPALALAGVIVAAALGYGFLPERERTAQPAAVAEPVTVGVQLAAQSQSARALAEALKREQTTALQMADPGARLVALSRTVQASKAAEARYTDFRTVFDLDGLLDAHIRTILDLPPARLSGERGRLLLEQAGISAVRIANASTSIDRAARTAVALARGGFEAQALKLFVHGFQRSGELAEPAASNVQLRLVRLASDAGPTARIAAAAWARDIAAARARSDALMIAARYDIAARTVAGPELQPFAPMRTLGAFDAAGPALLLAAETLRTSGKLAEAQAAALAAPRSVAGRDAVLAAITSDYAVAGTQLETVTAPLAIVEQSRRDDALSELATALIAKGYLADAGMIAQRIVDPALRARVQAGRADALAELRLDAKARTAAALALEAKAGAIDGVSERTHELIASAYARIGDGARVREHIRALASATQRDAVRLLLADAVAGERNAELLRETAAALETAGGRARGALATARLASTLDDFALVERSVQSIDDPVLRGWADAEQVNALVRQNRGTAARALAMSLAARARAERGAAAQPLAAAAVRALALVDEPARAEAFLPLGLAPVHLDGERVIRDIAEYDEALRALAAAWVRAGELDRAQRVVQWATRNSQFATVQSAVIEALAQRRNIAGAARLASEMTDVRRRIAALRSTAEESLKQLDRNDMLAAGGARPAQVRPTGGYADPVLRKASFDFYVHRLDDYGDAMPGVPQFKQLNSATISAAVPAVSAADERRVSVLPMSYNAYNTKFISGVNLAFRDVGQGFFPEAAQNTRYPLYIHLEAGVHDLPRVHQHLRKLGFPDALTRSGNVFQLNLPLLVAPGATLALTKADVDELRLQRESGTFIVNGGTLQFVDVDVVGWDSQRGRPAELALDQRDRFRPFIISWGGSRMDATRTHFSNLGFESSKAYGFSYSQGNTRVLRTRPGSLPRPTGTLVNNSFEDLYFGFFSYEADDVLIVGNEYRNNVVYGIDPHDYSQRLLIALNSAYGSKQKHGIIGSRSVDNSWYVGNLSFGNRGTGLMLDRMARANLIYGNRIWDNRGDGIAVFESPCNLLIANDVKSPGGDGIKVRNSWDIGIFANRIESRKKTGVNIYMADPDPGEGHAPRNVSKDPFSYFAAAAIARNTIVAQGSSGIEALGAGAALIGPNDFVGGRKKLLTGDFASEQQAILKLAQDGAVVRSSCPPPGQKLACRFVRAGLLPPSVEALQPARGSACAAQLAAAQAGTATQAGESEALADDDDPLEQAALVPAGSVRLAARGGR